MCYCGWSKFDRWLDELFESNQKKVPSEIIEQIKAWLESIRQDLANENGIEFLKLKKQMWIQV